MIAAVGGSARLVTVGISFVPGGTSGAVVGRAVAQRAYTAVVGGPVVVAAAVAPRRVRPAHSQSVAGAISGIRAQRRARRVPEPIWQATPARVAAVKSRWAYVARRPSPRIAAKADAASGHCSCYRSRVCAVAHSGDVARIGVAVWVGADVVHRCIARGAVAPIVVLYWAELALTAVPAVGARCTLTGPVDE